MDLSTDLREWATSLPVDDVDGAASGIAVLRPPKAPLSVGQTGLSRTLIEELLIKTFHEFGPHNLPQLAERTKLTVAVLEDVLGGLRQQQAVELREGGGNELAFVFRLSGRGSDLARAYLARNRYVGPAPVAWDEYVARVIHQSMRPGHISRQRIARAFAGFVLRGDILDQVGCAMNSRRPILIHGLPGAGKSYLARHMARLIEGSVDVPYALAVDAQIVRVFDPFIHIPVDHGEAQPVANLDRQAGPDRRWITCERPLVPAGGDLALAMLDLELDDASQVYEAPLQIKANNGMLLIDDLGRQRGSLQGLLNRLTIPLERKVDYFGFHAGKRFEAPIDAIVVFSTNLRPAEIGNESFLRRIGYKIHLGQLGRDQYAEILRQVCDTLGVVFDETAVRHLVEQYHKPAAVPLLACHPRALAEKVRDIAAYEETEPRLTPALLRKAWLNYFGELPRRGRKDHSPEEIGKEPS